MFIPRRRNSKKSSNRNRQRGKRSSRRNSVALSAHDFYLRLSETNCKRNHVGTNSTDKDNIRASDLKIRYYQNCAKVDYDDDVIIIDSPTIGKNAMDQIELRCTGKLFELIHF